MDLNRTELNVCVCVLPYSLRTNLLFMTASNFLSSMTWRNCPAGEVREVKGEDNQWVENAMRKISIKDRTGGR